MNENDGVLTRYLKKLQEDFARQPQHGVREQPKRAGKRGRGYTKPSFYNKRRRKKRRIRRKMAQRSRKINRSK